ncbi:MAG TPA: hypothetical protein VKU19_29605 [Bryobacteraceae bacterium]|nr:hypothetical protein [Bryobacteraceae bacterium]
MTPAQYMERYKNIWVPIDGDRSMSVSVKKYVLASDSSYNASAADLFLRTLARRGIDSSVRVDTPNGTTRVDPRQTKHADAIKQGKRDLVLSSGGLNGKELRVDTRVANWYSMAQFAFWGKGSPEACQIVLQLAVNWGLTANPQDYADAALGIDCNGFVGNYMWHMMGKSNDWTSLGVANHELGPNSPIRSGYYDRYKGHLIKRWQDLDNSSKYIMMLTDDHGEVVNQKSGRLTAHIVITEPGGRQDRPGDPNSFAVTVVESTAGANPTGLTKSYYLCQSFTADGTFSLYRESMIAGHKEVKFKIAKVG